MALPGQEHGWPRTFGWPRTLFYDDEGNRLTRTSDVVGQDIVGHTEYEWDHRNRLESVSHYVDDQATTAYQVVSYTYDDLNQMISRTVDHNTEGLTTRFFVYQNDQIIMQFDGDGTSEELTHRYLWGGERDEQLADEQIDWADNDLDVMWALSDHQGTVRDLAKYTDHAGYQDTVVWKHRRFDSFGNVMSTLDRGDFDRDGDLDIDDVNALLAEVYSNGTVLEEFDLNDNGVYDLADIELMIEDVIETIMGDSDLDGSIVSADLNAVILNWGQTNGGWNLGDYDGDGVTSSGDLNYIIQGNWGNSVSTVNTAGVEYIFGYTGRLFDDATGLQNNLNRWYDAKVGRWISEDPIGFAAGDANIYRYVGNSPTNFTDPSGLDSDYVTDDAPPPPPPVLSDTSSTFGEEDDLVLPDPDFGYIGVVCAFPMFNIDLSDGNSDASVYPPPSWLDSGW